MSHIHFDGIGMTSKRTRDRLVQRLQEQGIERGDVLDLIACTPRHWFLDEALSHRAYEDTSLPIGYGQTLSQPYIVARMTELLLNHASQLTKVLEVGTGSGYQTAILAQIAGKVWTVERIRPLQEKARERLTQLKLYNIRYKHADGGFGWSQYGGYDAILSTAAPASIPDELLEQLNPDGVLVIPVGTAQQNLVMVKREGEKQHFKQHIIEPVRFVPLLSGVTR